MFGKMKKAFRFLLEQVDFRINRFLGCTYWLHIGDLLTPCDGQITVGQYFIASRVLDIELIQAGKMPKWQNMFSERVYKKLDKKEKKVLNHKFTLLVDSLRDRGLNPITAQCSISDSPLVLNNGTHRIGWCILNEPNMYVPCVRDRHDLKPWFPIDGITFVGGLFDNIEVEELTKRYKLILEKEVRTELTAYMDGSMELKFVNVLSDYGEVVNKCEIQINEQMISVFRFRLRKQALFTKNRGNIVGICSKYITEMEKKLNNNCNIAHTVTQSLDMESKLEEQSGRKLFNP